MPGGEAALLGFGERGKKFADDIECLEIRDRIGARGAPDGRLIDEDDFVEPFVAFDCVPQDGSGCAAVGLRSCGSESLIEHVMQQRRLARARDARDRDQHVQRNFEIDALEIVGARARDQNFVRSGNTALRRNLNVQFVGEIAAGKRLRHLRDLSVGALADDFAPALAGAGTEVENAVGGAHDVGVVLDHEDCVSQIAQVVQDLDEAMRVAAVQADGRLIEHIERADQMRAERGRQLNALRFAARKRRSQPVEREVFEADVVEEAQALSAVQPAAVQQWRLAAGESSSCSKKRAASSTVMLQTWQMFLP